MMTPETATLDPETTQAVEKYATSALPAKITTHSEYEQIARSVLDAKGVMKRVKEFFVEPKRAMDAAKKVLLDREKDYLAGPEAFVAGATPLMTGWAEHQEKLRIEEQTRLQDLARKRAEEDQLREALAAEAAGDVGMAEAIMEAEAPVRTVTLKPIVQEVRGVSYRSVWRAVVDDPMKVPREYLVVDEAKLHGMARVVKGPSTIPGVRFVEEKVVAGRVS